MLKDDVVKEFETLKVINFEIKTSTLINQHLDYEKNE